ncbi:hypothetical protein EYE40_05055 [Glaciihabitans arcticus]|uniref:Uncharacterized protein n=1 Tax=Glaciihabitans arcticus TaxID=2668039 RepID=A0A4Q9GUH1_9MICO|nr:hypothetical protein [Glaciihabitans arcticus]TBN56817.1 hypothetical protein EYE40_05055 [Glaciihabitans arcticus]
MSVSMAPLPLTVRNITVGAAWTLLLFVGLTSWFTGLGVTVLYWEQGIGAPVLGAFGAGYALLISGVLGTAATALLGVPLTLAVSMLLRRSSSVRAHASGAAAAGALSAFILVVIAFLVMPSSPPIAEPSLWVVLPYGVLVLVTAASSAGGWLIAFREHREIPTTAEVNA